MSLRKRHQDLTGCSYQLWKHVLTFLSSTHKTFEYLLLVLVISRMFREKLVYHQYTWRLKQNCSTTKKYLMVSIAPKVPGILFHEEMVNHLTDNNFITDAQHGFSGNRSCLTNFLCYLNYLVNATDRDPGLSYQSWNPNIKKGVPRHWRMLKEKQTCRYQSCQRKRGATTWVLGHCRTDKPGGTWLELGNRSKALISPTHSSLVCNKLSGHSLTSSKLNNTKRKVAC